MNIWVFVFQFFCVGVELLVHMAILCLVLGDYAELYLFSSLIF